MDNEKDKIALVRNMLFRLKEVFLFYRKLMNHNLVGTMETGRNERGVLKERFDFNQSGNNMFFLL